MQDEVYAAMVPGRFASSARFGEVYQPLPRAERIAFMNATNQRFAASGVVIRWANRIPIAAGIPAGATLTSFTYGSGEPDEN